MSKKKSGSSVPNEYKGVRGWQTMPPRLPGAIFRGRVWVKRAGMYQEYVKFNTKGTPDISNWISA